MIRELLAEELLELFAAGNRTPGAGSAAALSGALAGSLCQAAARYAAKAGAPFRERAGVLLAEARERTERLRGAVEEDAAAFDRYWQLRLELRSAEGAERADLEAQATEALRRATEVPIEIARQCSVLAEIGFELHEKGHARARAEAVMAILAAVAGGEGAAHTAQLNLQAVGEGSWAAGRREEVREISSLLLACRRRIEAQIHREQERP